MFMTVPEATHWFGDNVMWLFAPFHCCSARISLNASNERQNVLCYTYIYLYLYIKCMVVFGRFGFFFITIPYTELYHEYYLFISSFTIHSTIWIFRWLGWIVPHAFHCHRSTMEAGTQHNVFFFALIFFKWPKSETVYYGGGQQNNIFLRAPTSWWPTGRYSHSKLHGQTKIKKNSFSYTNKTIRYYYEHFHARMIIVIIYLYVYVYNISFFNISHMRFAYIHKKNVRILIYKI